MRLHCGYENLSFWQMGHAATCAGREPFADPQAGVYCASCEALPPGGAGERRLVPLRSSAMGTMAIKASRPDSGKTVA